MRSERCLLNWTVIFIIHTLKIERKRNATDYGFLKRKDKEEQPPLTGSRDFETVSDKVTCAPSNNSFMGTNDQTSDTDITELNDIAASIMLNQITHSYSV